MKSTIHVISYVVLLSSGLIDAIPYLRPYLPWKEPRDVKLCQFTDNCCLHRVINTYWYRTLDLKSIYRLIPPVSSQAVEHTSYDLYRYDHQGQYRCVDTRDTSEIPEGEVKYTQVFDIECQKGFFLLTLDKPKIKGDIERKMNDSKSYCVPTKTMWNRLIDPDHAACAEVTVDPKVGPDDIMVIWTTYVRVSPFSRPPAKEAAYIKFIPSEEMLKYDEEAKIVHYKVSGLVVESIKNYIGPVKVCVSNIDSHIYDRSRDPMVVNIALIQGRVRKYQW